MTDRGRAPASEREAAAERLRQAVTDLHRWDVSRGWGQFNTILGRIDDHAAALAAHPTPPPPLPIDVDALAEALWRHDEQQAPYPAKASGAGEYHRKLAGLIAAQYLPAATPSPDAGEPPVDVPSLERLVTALYKCGIGAGWDKRDYGIVGRRLRAALLDEAPAGGGETEAGT